MTEQLHLRNLSQKEADSGLFVRPEAYAIWKALFMKKHSSMN